MTKRFSRYDDEKYYNVVKDNTEDKIYDDATEIASLLNDSYSKVSRLQLENTSLVMLNQEMCNVVDICINLMEECNLKNMKELQDVVREACTPINKGDNEKI